MARREHQADPDRSDPACPRTRNRWWSSPAWLALAALAVGGFALSRRGEEGKRPDDGPIRGRLSRQAESVRAVAYSPVDQTLAIGRRDGLVAVSDRGRPPRLMSPEANADGLSEIFCLAFSPDGRVLASGDARSRLTLWDMVGDGRIRRVIPHPAPVHAAAFTPDGQRLVTGGDDGVVRVWDLRTGRLAAALAGHPAAIHAVACSADGLRVASGSTDGKIRVWDAATWSQRAEFPMPYSRVKSLAFAPDGRTLAAGGGFPASTVGGGELILWDVESGRERSRLLGHRGYVTSVAFSPDGRTLASASADLTVRLWDMATGAARACLCGHEGYVASVAFSADGRWLASGGMDAMSGLWDLADAKLAGAGRAGAAVPATPLAVQHASLDPGASDFILVEDVAVSLSHPRPARSFPDGDRPAGAGS